MGGLIAMLVMILYAVHGPTSSARLSTARNVSSVGKELAKLEERFPDQQRLSQWSATVDEPLDTELHSLFHDARNLAQGLVRNFVPDSLTQSLTAPTDPQANP
jgi:hypothetical protein